MHLLLCNVHPRPNCPTRIDVLHLKKARRYAKVSLVQSISLNSVLYISLSLCLDVIQFPSVMITESSMYSRRTRPAITYKEMLWPPACDFEFPVGWRLESMSQSQISFFFIGNMAILLTIYSLMSTSLLPYNQHMLATVLNCKSTHHRLQYSIERKAMMSFLSARCLCGFLTFSNGLWSDSGEMN